MPAVNAWGDAILEEPAPANSATNEWGDPIETNQLAAPTPSAPGASPFRPASELTATARSTVTGFTPAEAQARGEAGAAGLARASAEVAAPALRIGGPLAGVALAPFTGLSSLPAGLALGTAGAALAEPLAQQAEIAAGQREALNYNEGVLNVAIAGPLSAIGIPFANKAGAPLISRIAQAGARAVEGGAINTAQGAVMREAYLQPQTGKDLLTDFVIGAGAGVAIATPLDELARARRLQFGIEAARPLGFAGNTEDELRSFLFARARDGRAAPQPVEPAPTLPQEPTSGAGAAPPNPVAPKPTAGGSTPPPATTPAGRVTPPGRVIRPPLITSAQWQELSRVDKVGNLAHLSNAQLATLTNEPVAPLAASVAEQPAASPADVPTAQPLLNEWGDPVEQPTSRVEPGPVAQAILNDAPLPDDTPVERIRYNLPDLPGDVVDDPATAETPPEPVTVADIPATASTTMAGPVVAPTESAYRKVSQLADKKQLKVQKEFLLAAVDDAATRAQESQTISPEGLADLALPLEGAGTPESIMAARNNLTALGQKYGFDTSSDNLARWSQHNATFSIPEQIAQKIRSIHGEHITIEVPGDGTFRVPNTQQHLKAFSARMKKSFGNGLSASYPRTPPTSPSPITPLSSKVGPKEITAAVSISVSKDDTRVGLQQAIKDGAFTVATNGRVLAVAVGGEGLPLGKNREIGTLKSKDGTPMQFPNWRQVLPEALVKIGPKTITPAIKPQVIADAAEVLKILNRIDGLLHKKSGAPTAVRLHNIDGKLGISYISTEGIERPKGQPEIKSIGDFRSENVPAGHAGFIAIDSEYLGDIMTQARKLGNNEVPLAYVDGISPLASFIGKNAVNITMPVRVEGIMNAPGEAAQAPKPKASKTKTKTPTDQAPSSSPNAAAYPGAAGAAAYPGPDAFTTAPSDDPTFSQLPAELPEAVQFYIALSGGPAPKIREKVGRMLGGTALGVFRHTDGPHGEFSITLRADLFQLVSKSDKQRLLNEAVLWTKAQQALYPNLNFEEVVSKRFEELVKAAERKALTENPKQALAVLWHEIGHLVDWLPDKTLRRGNFLGHIAALKRNFKPFLAEHPGMDPQPVPPTRAEQDKLRRQAEKELGDRVTEVVEIIRREEPIYRELPITADNITSILKNAQRDEFPGLYDWFAGLERAEKAAVLRSAMKGVVDARAAQFSRREPTGETRIVEEEKRTTTGIPATPEEIRARFEELLRAELRRRGLISERELRAEAAEVIKWWQGVSEVPKYFQTATETWAELFSATMNNPAGVAKRAPTFWRAFNAYLEARPEVAQIYRAMQDSIKSGAIHRERVLNLRDMFHRDEDNSLMADTLFQAMDGNSLRDTLSVLFNRQTGPIQRRALAVLRKDKNDKFASAALSGLKNYLYRATGWEAFARDLNLHVEAPLAAANLHHDDMSEYLFHSRIVAGDRQQLANPLGWSPKTSAERLQAMEAELDPQRWATLEEAAVTFRAIYEEQVVSLLKQADILTPELIQIIEDRTQYATFAKAREFNPLEAGTLQGALENRYGKDVTARIYRQIGTLGEIRSPYLATVQKAFSIISTARRQIALKSIVNFLAEHEPQSIIPAQERFADGRWEPVPMETRHVGTLYTLNKGKVEAFYVPRPIFEMMNYGSPLESQIVGLAHKALTWPKAILTELNPGFWPVAFAKDIVTMAVQLPQGMRAVRQLPAAFTAARASMTSKPSPLADDALRRLMVISRADSRGEHLGQADELSRILMRMGQTPQLWDAEAEKISRFLRFWMAWKRQGQTLERTIKFAGMKHLDEAFPDMPEWEKKRIVNEQSGSPDFLEKGRAAPLVDLWMMFYNPWLRGVEAMKTSAQGDPRGFWTKFLGTVGLAAAAYWMFEQGMIDGGLDPADAEDKRDMMRSIPERDKRRGFAIPLAWSDKEQGKVAYIVLPFPDSLRYLHTAQRSMLQAMSEGGNGGEGFKTFLSYQGQDLPGQNPMITEAGKWYDYHVLGRNPYDEFLGRGALNEDKVTAGTAGTELALQSLSNITGGIVYRYRPDRPGEKPTDLEKFLQTPVVGNLLGRWVRVSNRGLAEQTDKDVAAVRQREAELRLVGEEMIGRQMRGEAWSPAQEQLFTEEPYLAQRIVNRQMDLMKQATAPEMRAWDQAKSQGERMALLDAWSKREAERAKRLEK